LEKTITFLLLLENTQSFLHIVVSYFNFHSMFSSLC
jgi:hypothetical protein